MAAYPLHIQLLLWIYLLLLAIDSGVAQQSFLIEPSSAERSVGDSAVLLCSVSGKEGALTWVKDSTTAISNDRTIIDTSLTSKYQITGDDPSGSYNLNISNLLESDSGNYECRVSAAGSSNAITSSTVVLTVLAIPVQAFTTQPGNTQAVTGNSATLQCIVGNKEGDLEWSKDGSVISNNTDITDPSLNRYSVMGTTSNGEYNLQIVAVEMSDAGMYSCRVTASGGSAAIVSDNAVLTVRDASEVQSILIPPSDKTATVGTDVTLVCYVSALSGSVRWLRDGVQISENRAIVNGDESGRISIIGSDGDGEYNFHISDVEEEDQALYFCVLPASGDDPSVSSSPATLTVSPAVEPSSTSPLCSITPSSNLSENDVVTLTCESTGGEPQPTLTWSNDLDANLYKGNQTEDSASATNSLIITLVKDLNGVMFSCRSTHPAYSLPKECTLSPLIFELVATINVTVNTNRLTIEEDKPGELMCSASGDPPVLGYNWFYNGIEISNTDDRFVISTTNAKDSSTFGIVTATLSMDDATVQCEAYNRIDSRRANVVLTIKEDNLFKYVITTLVLIGVIIFVAIVIGFIIWVCHTKNKKNRTIHPDVEANGATKPLPNKNFFITANHMETGAIPNGIVRAENEEKTQKKHKQDKKHKKDKKHRKHKKDKSKVLDHDSTPAPNPLSTRDGDHDALPTITGYKKPGTSSRDPGFYPTSPPMYPLDAQSPLPRYKEGYAAGDPNSAQRSSAERSSKDQDATISLSPGEYQKRDEYEKKMKELQGLRSDLVAGDGEKKKKKHKKHKKDKSTKEPR